MYMPYTYFTQVGRLYCVLDVREGLGGGNLVNFLGRCVKLKIKNIKMLKPL
jgi:hypothetical protein